MLRERGCDTVGGYNVLIVNRRLSQRRHCLLGLGQHPALCLPARSSELSRLSLYQPHVACFIQLSIPLQSRRHQLRSMSVLPHRRRRVDDMSVTRSSGGSTYTRVMNFGRFFGLKVRDQLICGSPYTREYIVVHGLLLCTFTDSSRPQCRIVQLCKTRTPTCPEVT